MQRMARTTRSRIGLRRLAAVGLAIAAGAVLTACGQAQPGVAASVDGVELSVAELQAQTNAFFESYPEARGQASPTRVAQVLIQNFARNRIVDKIGASYGLEPTQSDLEAFATENYESLDGFTQAMANAAIGSDRQDLVMRMLRDFWIENAVRERLRDDMGLPEGQNDELDIATQDVNERFTAETDVEVNPRYGAWDPTATIVVDATGSISVPEPGTEESLAPAG